MRFEAQDPGEGSFGSTAPPVCRFNGVELADGQTVEAFQNSTVPFGQACVSETRVCVGATLTGSYNYAFCQPSAPSGCLFNGLTVNHGASVEAYYSSSGNCVKETRTCDNGSLSGSFTFASCTQTTSCLFNGMTLENGQSTLAFQASSVPFGQTCISETRSCVNGNLSGTYQYASCNVQTPSSCLFNGQTVAHGQWVTAYKEPLVTNACESEVRTCNNGVLSGSYIFESCHKPQPCALPWGGTIANGATVSAFATCNDSMVRTCDDAILSGASSYKYQSCTNVCQPGYYTNCPCECH